MKRLVCPQYLVEPQYIEGYFEGRWTVYPDVAISNPGRGTFKPLQLRIFRKVRVTEDITLGEVPVLPKNACSQLPKGPLQGFFSTPARFRYFFSQLAGLIWFFCLRPDYPELMHPRSQGAGVE